MNKYFKFSLFHLIGLMSIIAISLGGHFITLGFTLLILFYIGGDLILGDDTSVPEYHYPKLLTAMLWLALPMLIAIVFVTIWHFSPIDLFGYGAHVNALTNIDIIANRQNTSFMQYCILSVYVGLTIGIIGTVTGHELTHRTWDPTSILIGRWLLAFSFDANFAIEHVYGHHQYVSTKHDPATAPRGRNVYAHILISTVKGNISAWKIEQTRLRRKKLAILSIHNKVIRGYLMSVVLLILVSLASGTLGAAFFVFIALIGKSVLEIVNYIEHYGIVRADDSPVFPRHSWNSNKRVSSIATFNLTRHSHHHAHGNVPFYKLEPYQDAPMMIAGYLSTIVITLIPPLWNKLMTPKVLEWDSTYATNEELKLANEANQKSGLKEFEQITYDT